MSGIDAFWAFWSRNADRLEAFATSGEPEALLREFQARIEAVHPDLDWEFAPGRRARHALCLSGKGDPALRLLAEQWAAAGPQDDPAFEFWPVRLPHPGSPSQMELGFDGVRVPFAELRFHLEDDDFRERVHVGAWHPLFDQLPEQVRGTVTMLALDNALGEDGVETWVGSIEVLERSPDHAVDIDQLRDHIDRVSTSWKGDRLAMLRGDDPDSGKPRFAVIAPALKRWRHPAYDVRVEIAVRIAEPDEAGLPSKEELARLQGAEEVLLRRLEGHAVCPARETFDGMRRVFLYTARDGMAWPTIEAWRRSLDWEVTVRREPDPGWTVLERYVG